MFFICKLQMAFHIHMVKLQMGYSVFHVVKLIGNFQNVLIEFLSFYITVYLQRASMVVQMVKNLPVVQETRVQSLGRGRSPGERNGNPLQYSCLENLMDRGAWWVAVHGVPKSWARLSD